ncbi:type VII secretion integral membrane protein EccD [Mycolicibacterium duvalii]|uniref:ESX-3 secretion system protein EccD3 n=1 Tax=Mycolicibacterium duvalii TaxID=39688 RepID=A0A7I7K4T6_9MYCO|nr:type VII secretion integral membrane protein EccD [Mycolicibacterium duvalii]MCV7369003.1 type VII secretion integral membrane protein EccD [Mycolicibacterium duvalii]PEG44480.1 type VII secretion integral membrane protein EccD [Mycolicibacterium duvalii]BBX19097.1 ESX-3 secretion system protein EccD3 [Mycolicibacterium duvalii]
MSEHAVATHNAVMPIVRVAVLTAAVGDEDAGRLTEIALPAELPLREIIPAIQRIVAPADTASDAATLVSLAPIGGAPFSLDATLATVGVVDGDLLALQPVPVGPPAPRIVEDIADAAMIFSRAREKPWGVTQIRRGATVAVLGLIVAATALSVATRVITGETLGLVVVSATAVLSVLGALLARPASARLATALAVTALLPVAGAFALAVPGDFGAAHIVLSAAGVAAWSIISIIVGERAIALFTATATTALGVLLAAGAAAVWTVTPLTLGCGLVLLALLVTVAAAQLSAMCARLPVPAIPAPGDPAPSAQPLRVLEELPRRVQATDSHQTGFIAAGVLLGVTGSVALLWPAFGDDGGPSVWSWYLVVAVALGAALRARVWDSATCKAWLLAHPALVTIVVSVCFAVTGNHLAAWGALAVLGLLTAAWVVVALNPRIGEAESYSLPMRRMLGFLASALDASIIPVMAYVVGIFAWVLNGF